MLQQQREHYTSLYGLTFKTIPLQQGSYIVHTTDLGVLHATGGSSVGVVHRVLGFTFRG